MKGTLMPVVVLPRYTSLLGGGTFTTVPVDVSEYSAATLTLWRGYTALGGSFTAYFEDSHDALEWTVLNGSGSDPGANASVIVRFDLSRRWLRARVVLASTDSATCWVVGALEERVEG